MNRFADTVDTGIAAVQIAFYNSVAARCVIDCARNIAIAPDATIQIIRLLLQLVLHAEHVNNVDGNQLFVPFNLIEEREKHNLNTEDGFFDGFFHILGIYRIEHYRQLSVVCRSLLENTL